MEWWLESNSPLDAAINTTVASHRLKSDPISVYVYQTGIKTNMKMCCCTSTAICDRSAVNTYITQRTITSSLRISPFFVSMRDEIQSRSHMSCSRRGPDGGHRRGSLGACPACTDLALLGNRDIKIKTKRVSNGLKCTEVLLSLHYTWKCLHKNRAS